MNGSDESPAVVELPDDAIEARLRGFLADAEAESDEMFGSTDNVDRLVAGMAEWITDWAARVRAEAVADERQRIASEVEDEFRRRIQARVDQNRADGYPQTADAMLAGAGYLLDVLREWAAGSVPVATPADDEADNGPACGWLKEPGMDGSGCVLPAGHCGSHQPVATPPAESYRACAGCDGPDLCRYCQYRVITPTEPTKRCDGTLGERPYWMGVDQYDPCRCWLPAGHTGGCQCEHANDGATPPFAASPVPAEQPSDDLDVVLPRQGRNTRRFIAAPAEQPEER